MKKALYFAIFILCNLFNCLSAQTNAQSELPVWYGEYDGSWTDAMTGIHHEGTAKITFGRMPYLFGYIYLPEGYVYPFEIHENFPYFAVQAGWLADLREDYAQVSQFPEINGVDKNKVDLFWDESKEELIFPDGFGIKIGKEYPLAVTWKPEIWWYAKDITLVKKKSSVIDIPLDREGEPEYFTLQGVKVHKPDPGMVVIRVSNGKATKVIFFE